MGALKSVFEFKSLFVALPCCGPTVQVIVREQETNHRIVVRTMTEGSYFGEISLLRLDAGCNK